ncbi:MAG: Arm DNA-binding domain-containing protein, partial [Acidimicrobiales bacterium]
MRRCPRDRSACIETARWGWYLKVTLGSDHTTGRREQLTRRGFRTATEAGVARR